MKTWSTFTRPDGQCDLLDMSGNVLATFADWQVAEYVVNMRLELSENTDIISTLEDKVLELEHLRKEDKQEIKDLEERTEHDHRTILDLEKEIDDLKTQLWNATHS